MKGWIVVFLLAMAATAAADELTLKNGDRITGKVVGMKGGKLLFETAHSGVISVDWAQIASLKTDADVKVRLKAGQVLAGKVSLTQDGMLKVEETTVDPATIKSFNEPDVTWHGFVDLSARSTDGNTHTRGAVFNAEAVRAGESDRIIFKATARWSEVETIDTEKAMYGLGKYERTISGDLYGYASVEGFKDRFKDLNLRAIGSVGAGYHVLKEDWVTLSTEAGLTYVDNDFEFAEDEGHAGARLAVMVKAKLPLGFEISDTAVFYPNFEDNTDWQAHNEAAIGRSLGGNLSFRAGMITDWDDYVLQGLKKYDNIYYVGLGFIY